MPITGNALTTAGQALINASFINQTSPHFHVNPHECNSDYA